MATQAKATAWRHTLDGRECDYGEFHLTVWWIGPTARDLDALNRMDGSYRPSNEYGWSVERNGVALAWGTEENSSKALMAALGAASELSI